MSNDYIGGAGSNIIPLIAKGSSDANAFQSEFLEAYNAIKAEAEAKSLKPKRNTAWKKGGESFVRIRNVLGLNQQSFSKLIGVSKTGLSNWETGLFRPRFHTLVSMKYTLDDFGKKIGKPGLADIIVMEDFGYTNRGESIKD